MCLAGLFIVTLVTLTPERTHITLVHQPAAPHTHTCTPGAPAAGYIPDIIEVHMHVGGGWVLVGDWWVTGCRACCVVQSRSWPQRPALSIPMALARSPCCKSSCQQAARWGA